MVELVIIIKMLVCRRVLRIKAIEEDVEKNKKIMKACSSDNVL